MANYLLVFVLAFINLTPTAYNVYSPDLVIQNSQEIMYFGGWMSAADLPYDAIYRCPMPCTNPREVIAPPFGSLVQVNDPTLVQMPGGYWIMYMTGSTSLGGELTSQGVYFATSWDGIIWSTPQLLIQGYWLPSAVLKDGRVYLYVNPTVSPNKQWRFDLGTSGVSVGAPVITTHAQPYNYANVDVMCHPSISLCQMVAENIGNFPASQIDYLYSSDGLNWIFGQTIITALAGNSVRTPTMHPGTAYYIYFGCSISRDGLNNQVCFYDWSP